MGWKSRPVEVFRLGQFFSSAGSRTNVSINSAYVNRTSGASVGFRVQSMSSDPVNEVYVFLDATTGTRANVSMLAKVYDLHTTGSQPGTTLRATSDSASLPATDDNWIRFVFPTPYSPAIGEYFFITIENTAAAPATDFPMILNGSAAQTANQDRQVTGVSSANGYSTAGTQQFEMPFVIVQGSEAYGQPVVAIGSYATFTGRRGMLIGPDWKGFVGRRISYVASSSNSRFQIFELSTPPTGTPVFDTAIPTIDATLGNLQIDFDFSTLAGSGPWVMCTNTTASIAFGSLGLIEGYSAFPAIFDALYDNFAMCPSVVQSGSVWVVDRGRPGGMNVDLDRLAAPAPGPSSGLLSQGFVF